MKYQTLGSTSHKILHPHANTHTHKYTCTHTCLQICMHAHTHKHTTHRGCFFPTIFTVKVVETVTSSEQMGTSEHSGIPSYWQQEKVRAISFNFMLTGRLSWNWGAFLKPFSNKKDDNIFTAKDEVSFCEMGCEEQKYGRNDSNIPSLKWTASLCQTFLFVKAISEPTFYKNISCTSTVEIKSLTFALSCDHDPNT